MDVVDAGDRVEKGDGGPVGCGDWVAVEMGEGGARQRPLEPRRVGGVDELIVGSVEDVHGQQHLVQLEARRPGAAQHAMHLPRGGPRALYRTAVVRWRPLT